MTRLANATHYAARKLWLWRHRGAFGQSDASAVPRLLVDISAIFRRDAKTGIQRVVRAVWSELKSRDGQNFNLIPVFANARHGYCYAPLDFIENSCVPQSSVPVGVRPGDKFLGLDLSAHFLPKYREQLRSWRHHGATVHIVIYDLLPLLHPEWFRRQTFIHFGKWLNLIGQEADQALCISDYVARELITYLGSLPKPRHINISRLHLGGDIAASLPSNGISKDVRQLISRLRHRKALLMVGTIEPRKAYDVALSAFEHLWRTEPEVSPDLVIVGKAGWKTEKLQRRIMEHPEAGRRLHWLGQVTDEGLCRFYEVCAGVVVTSRAEGFGLPLIEAYMNGRPVLARDLPVFREQGLPGVRFFKDESPQSLSRHLLEFMQTPPPRLHRSSGHTWSETVDDLLKGLEIELANVVSSPLARCAS